MFSHTIYSKKVKLNAPAEAVYALLSDLENYPNWNPFTHKVEGRLALGENVNLHVRMPIRGDRMSTEQVECIVPDRQLAWGMTMGHRWLLKARRDQLLVPINDDQCTYQTWDAFNGVLTPLVVSLFGKDMLNGFNSVADALVEKFDGEAA